MPFSEILNTRLSDYMNRLLSILLLCCIYSHLYAQTPYDSLSPATSRPILDVVQNLDAYHDSLQPSLMDAPLATTDDVSKWLSPDPLSDKYPEISPYSYCNWNPVKYIDPDGRDVISVAYNSETDCWDIENSIIAQGDDVISVIDKDGNTFDYIFSEGKYAERVNCLNLENTGDDGYALGVYHISGAKEGGTGYFVTPGGKSDNAKGSGKRIQEGIYPILSPTEGARWLFPGVGGVVTERGIRFHWGDGNPKNWTEGCFVLFSSYTFNDGNINIGLDNSQTSAITFSYLLGGVGIAKSKYKGRIGVLSFPYGIQDKLILKSR